MINSRDMIVLEARRSQKTPNEGSINYTHTNSRVHEPFFPRNIKTRTKVLNHLKFKNCVFNYADFIVVHLMIYNNLLLLNI